MWRLSHRLIVCISTQKCSVGLLWNKLTKHCSFRAELQSLSGVCIRRPFPLPPYCVLLPPLQLPPSPYSRSMFPSEIWGWRSQGERIASCLQTIPFWHHSSFGRVRQCWGVPTRDCIVGVMCSQSHLEEVQIWNFGSESAWVIKSENPAVYTIQVNSTRTGSMKTLQALLDYGCEANGRVAG